MRQVYETENNLLTSFMITVLEIIHCQHEITIRCVMSGVFDMADGRQQCPSHQLYGKVKDHICIHHTMQNPISECISAMATKILYLTLMRDEPMMSLILPLERSSGVN